ncbi:hypothetical protein EKD04_025815 [Chloroflexales bacterium ZM16-3]|nr:hypothetical protein [Chloroflexales bacterium ZM16-3]
MLTDRDRYTQGYRELRALVEEYLQSANPDDTHRFTAGLQEHLRLHCRSCGELLDTLLRAQGDPFCYACVDPAPLRPGP